MNLHLREPALQVGEVYFYSDGEDFSFHVVLSVDSSRSYVLMFTSQESTQVYEFTSCAYPPKFKKA